MGRRVVLTGFVVAVALGVPGRDGRLQPFQDVGPESRLVIVHEHRGGNVHRTYEDEALLDAALTYLRRYFVGDVDDLLPLLGGEPQIVRMTLHSLTPVSNCRTRALALDCCQQYAAFVPPADLPRACGADRRADRSRRDRLGPGGAGGRAVGRCPRLARAGRELRSAHAGACGHAPSLAARASGGARAPRGDLQLRDARPPRGNVLPLLRRRVRGRRSG